MYDCLKTLFVLIYFSYLSLAFFYYLKDVWRSLGLSRLVSLREEGGQGLVEYALILVMVAVVVIAVLLMLGPSIQNVF